MREIKFRAKAKCIFNWCGYNEGANVSEGDWVCGHYYTDILDSEDSESYFHPSYIRIAYGDSYADIEIDPATVGQFTGLQDKNGVDIYENDNVKTHAVCGKIFYDDRLGFVINGWPIYELGSDQSTTLFEVISNIHEEQNYEEK